ncbi:IclR family transcriptional regulator [Salibacterium aidingense]|uniref:IclR family transcriptional regulator n=1 Tax=Salibacterium aidingense TaxID=384933 RepID=UPI000424AF8B|nr:IclR family transcriptional regulator [Salibacterium aidingense]
MREINANPIRAVERSITVLEAFTMNKGKLSLDEVVSFTNIPRSTVYRILCTLEINGMLEFDEEDQRYRPGLKLVEIGVFLSSSLDIYQEAEDVLLKLQTDTEQTVVMALGDEKDIIYVFIKENNEGLKFSSVVGQRRPYTYGVLGYTLLAFEDKEKMERILREEISKRTPYTVTDRNEMKHRFENIRIRGLFTETDETTVGVTGVGAPVFDRKKKPAAAIGIVGPSIQLKDTNLIKAENLLFQAAEEISNRMGYKGNFFVNKSVKKDN